MLKILLITDGKAGHESLSNGLIKNLDEKFEVKTERVKSSIRAKYIKKIATIILNHTKIKKENIPFLIKLFYKEFSMNLKGKFDLIISTGGDTSFLNVLLAKYFDTPNIYCSSLRGLKHELFTYIISIIDNHIPNEIVVDFPPIRVETKQKELSGKFIGLLIGGVTKNYKFRDEEFVNMVQNSINLARSKGYKILLTTSRRTSIEVEKRIKEICEKNRNIVEKSVFFNDKPEKVVNFFLSNAEAILCSEDSGSMITESILAKKMVYTVKPKDTNPNKIYELFMQNIKNRRYAYSISVEDIEKITLEEEFCYADDKSSKKIINNIEKVLDKVKN